MLWASSRLKTTTAAAVSAPLFVAPDHSMSDPAFHLATAGCDPGRAEAVGGRPRADREDLDLRLEQRSEARLESLGGRIGAVRLGVTGVGGDQGGEDFGRGARHVVTEEVLLRAHSGLLEVHNSY